MLARARCQTQSLKGETDGQHTLRQAQERARREEMEKKLHKEMLELEVETTRLKAENDALRGDNASRDAARLPPQVSRIQFNPCVALVLRSWSILGTYHSHRLFCFSSTCSYIASVLTT